MSIQNRTTLCGYFETGDKPTQAEFYDFVDSAAILDATNAGAICGSNLYTGGAVEAFGGITSQGNVNGVCVYASGDVSGTCLFSNCVFANGDIIATGGGSLCTTTGNVISGNDIYALNNICVGIDLFSENDICARNNICVGIDLFASGVVCSASGIYSSNGYNTYNNTPGINVGFMAGAVGVCVCGGIITYAA